MQATDTKQFHVHRACDMSGLSQLILHITGAAKPLDEVQHPVLHANHNAAHKAIVCM